MPFFLLDYLKFKNKLKYETKKSDLLIINGLSETISIVTLIFALTHRKKVALIHHGLPNPIYSRLLSFVSNFYNKFVLKFFSETITTAISFSTNSYEELKEIGLDTTKVKMFNLGIDVDRLTMKYESTYSSLEEIQTNLNGRSSLNSPFALCIGRNVRNKGFDLAIKAIKEIDELGVNISLVICGEETSYTDQLKDLAKQLSITEKIVFLGVVDERMKLSLMRLSSVLLIPSIKEGYGLVALEAALLNIPVIATRTGAHEDILSNSKNSRLIKIDSINELTYTILELMYKNSHEIDINHDLIRKYDIKHLSKLYLEFLHKGELEEEGVS
jgi:glycosyltransferase involved in cell wall biosynthesis